MRGFKHGGAHDHSTRKAHHFVRPSKVPRLLQSTTFQRTWEVWKPPKSVQATKQRLTLHSLFSKEN